MHTIEVAHNVMDTLAWFLDEKWLTASSIQLVLFMI